MFRHLLLINYTFLKKWTLLCYLVFFISAFLIAEYFIGKNYASTIVNEGLILSITWEKMVVFVGGGMLMLGLAIHVFKIPAVSNFDLILVASKMTRRHLLMSKLVASESFVIMFSVVLFVVSLVAGTFYPQASTSGIFRHALSLALGELVVMSFWLALCAALVLALSTLPLVAMVTFGLSLIAFLPGILLLTPARPNGYNEAVLNDTIVQRETYNSSKQAGYAVTTRNPYLLENPDPSKYASAAWIDWFNQWARVYEWVTPGMPRDDLAAYTYGNTAQPLPIRPNDAQARVFTFTLNNKARQFVFLKIKNPEAVEGPWNDGEMTQNYLEQNTAPDLSDKATYRVMMGTSDFDSATQKVVRAVLTSAQLDFFAKLDLLRILDQALEKSSEVTELIATLEEKAKLRYSDGTITLLPTFTLNGTNGTTKLFEMWRWLPTLIELDEIVKHEPSVGAFAPTNESALLSNTSWLVEVTHPIQALGPQRWIKDEVIYPIWLVVFGLTIGGVGCVILRQNIN